MPRTHHYPVPGLPLGPAPGNDADRQFFARWPERVHRLRRAYPVERVPTPPPGMELYVVVTRLGPGVRRRLGFCLPVGIDTDEVSEGAIRAMIEGVGCR